LSGVESHPDADRQVVERALAGYGRGDRVVRTGEGVEERVALRVDLAAGGERLSEARQVLLEDGAVHVRAELPEQPGRSFDIGEEEGDGAGRQLAHVRELSQVRGSPALGWTA
jgi:hypothetical protein